MPDTISSDTALLENALLQLRAEDDLAGEGMRTVYRMMAKKMLRAAFTVTQNTADAEDVLQDSLLKLYQARDTYRPTGHPQAYVLTVVRHTALDLVRNRQKTITEDLSAVENTLEAPPDGSDGTAAVAELLAPLSAEDRLLVILRLYEELPYAEIARILGLSVHAAQKRYQRALAKLRTQFT